MILNNDRSYRLLIRKHYTTSIDQESWREVQSTTIIIWDSVDYPDYKFTLTNKEIKEFIKMIKD